MGMGAEGGFRVCLGVGVEGGLEGTINCGVEGVDGTEGVEGVRRDGDILLAASDATE